jgi:hypothetical protein
MVAVAKGDLDDLLNQLDAETRERWADLLEAVDAEIQEKGPAALRDHLDAALRHLLAIGWALHRCYSSEESATVMGPLGEAACTVEELRATLDLIEKKPEWSQ